ncbi:MAG TPA: MBOAT family O-acyltransferase [Bacteroidia bacterium]|nr:MBOAT family O-acyltransferase [Bacteroidia bacterium]
MVFSSITFLLYFLPLFLIAYQLVPKSFKNGFILLASIFFYSWGGPKFIFAILATTFLDFIFVQKMYVAKTSASKKFWLILSLCMNLGMLFYFKYANFFLENISDLFGIPFSVKKILLPVGISFYTFESITYMVDVYRGIHPPLKNFWQYQTYILLFPKLIAGPIVRFHEIADQITDRLESYDKKIHGLVLFCIGLSKKVILANTIGKQADEVFFMSIETIDTMAAWVGALSYTFQIYFDFSGYSDMAIGLCKFMGFDIPENFNNPYISQSITEFWRRWHITLGRWMKNYLYIPLGGNRVSKIRTFINLWIVFILSGLWHGANWNFIFWGAYHGLFLVLEKWTLLKWYEKIPSFIRVVITFVIVVTGWVLFRNEDIYYALSVIKKMYSFEFSANQGYLLNDFWFSLSLCVSFSFFTLFPSLYNLQQKIYNFQLSNTSKLKMIIASGILYYIALSYIAALDFNPFIYFRF